MRETNSHLAKFYPKLIKHERKEVLPFLRTVDRNFETDFT